jgi:hypothetical protein
MPGWAVVEAVQHQPAAARPAQVKDAIIARRGPEARVQASPTGPARQLVGSSYWVGLLAWVEDTMLARGNIGAADLSLISVADDPDEVVEIIRKAHGLSI